MGKLPGLTYTIHHSTDRLRRQQDYVEQEIIMTRKLMMGSSDIGLTAAYGVVAPTDPTAHTAGSTDPLAVSVNANNQLTIDVNPGVAVMQSGVWIQVHNIVRQIQLASTAVGVPNVVFLRYLLDVAPVEQNDFLEFVSPYTLRVGDPIDSGYSVSTESVLIGVATVDTYTQYSDTILQDLTPLAIVTMQTVTSGGATVNQLSIDHTQASYIFNRPWFSPVDLQHRAMVGTGAASNTNPHRTSANDLTVGDLSLFQLHLDHGMVVAKDKSIAKVPGYRCTTAVTTILTDDATGTATGYANAMYFTLPYFPVRVGRVWINSTNVTLGALHVPQTNRVVLPYDVIPANETVMVYYTRAEAAEPPLPGATTFQIGGPTAQELVVAGGAGIVNMGSTEETFADAYQFPMRYEMFVDVDGDVLKTPQVVYCHKRLDVIGTTDDISGITPYGPGRLIVGLMNASHVVTLDVQIRIYGKDTNGATINELFTFNHGNWAPIGTLPTIPTPTSTSLHFGTQMFASLDTLNVEVRTSDGPNSGVMVWMAQTPYSNYDKLADALHVATVDWDGLSLAHIYDKRPVAPTLRDDTYAGSKLQTLMYTLLAGGNQTIFIDDFAAPRYHSLETEDELNENSAHYPTYQFSKQQAGLHGYYRSIGFPVNPLSGTMWSVTMYGADRYVDAWFVHRPTLLSYEGGVWTSYLMTAVPGVPNTWAATTATVPTRVQVQLYPGQCLGMAVYG